MQYENGPNEAKQKENTLLKSARKQKTRKKNIVITRCSVCTHHTSHFVHLFFRLLLCVHSSCVHISLYLVGFFFLFDFNFYHPLRNTFHNLHLKMKTMTLIEFPFISFTATFEYIHANIIRAFFVWAPHNGRQCVAMHRSKSRTHWNWIKNEISTAFRPLFFLNTCVYIYWFFVYGQREIMNKKKKKFN